VKRLRFAVSAAALFAAGAPAAAQQLTAPSYEFVTAVRDGKGDKATQLLTDHPTLVDSRDGQGNTALIIAISRQDSDWTGFLLQKKADPNLGGKGGDTPLIAAARVGFEDAIEWLLSLGARADVSNRMGETPLIIAVQQRQPQIVKVLLDAGANPDKTDAAAGYSAREYAERDSRGRQILQMIEAKKPKASAKR
jgi:ankyrin repeat protein